MAALATIMIKDYHRETEFLRQCIRYNDTVEHHHLDAKITQLQRDELCVRRAVWLMAFFSVVAIAGLCYATMFLADSTPNVSELSERFIVKALCALGIGSMICMVAFLGLGLVYRKELDQRREACRRLAKEFLESRLGLPVPPSTRNGRAGKGAEDGNPLRSTDNPPSPATTSRDTGGK